MRRRFLEYEFSGQRSACQISDFSYEEEFEEEESIQSGDKRSRPEKGAMKIDYGYYEESEESSVISDRSSDQEFKANNSEMDAESSESGDEFGNLHQEPQDLEVRSYESCEFTEESDAFTDRDANIQFLKRKIREQK